LPWIGPTLRRTSPAVSEGAVRDAFVTTRAEYYAEEARALLRPVEHLLPADGVGARAARSLETAAA
jgi:hypothetical protein